MTRNQTIAKLKRMRARDEFDAGRARSARQLIVEAKEREARD